MGSGKITADGVVSGTSGNDTILPGYVDANGDMVDGNDAILPGTFGNDDVIVAGAGNDSVDAGAGNDLVYGGAGNDTLLGAAGNDTIYGDSGYLSTTSSGSNGGGSAGVDEGCGTTGGSAGGSMGSGTSGGTVAVAAGNDLIYGGDGNDVIYGEGGNDTLAGGAGTNHLFGGAGDDAFVGGAGADVFDGGSGQDNLDYSGSGGAVNVNLTTGAMSGGDADNDSISGGIDGVVGSQFGDHLVGFDRQGTDPADTYTNQFWGNGGNDTIEGKGGDDLIYGGADQDRLDGAGGSDTVSGDAGNDSITGGAGADQLSGGDDRDLFIGGNGGDSVDGGEGGDDHDTLDLTGAGPLSIVYDTANSENGTVTFYDDAHNVTGTLAFQNIENVIPCFTPGTMIATPRGEVAVEMLRAGDRIITRDNGIQEIRWIGRRDLSWNDLQANTHLKPVLVQQGALGNGLPERDMLVSPNHRLLVANDRTALYFDEHEVLVAAKHLAAGRGVHSIDAGSTSYIHFMCDRHEVVLSNGAWTESFQPGDYTLRGMGNAQRSEIFDLFPDLKTDAGLESYAAARRTLKRHEAMLIVR